MLLCGWVCLVILKSKNGENTNSVALYKKLCSNSAIQGNRVHFTALRVVCRERLFPKLFGFPPFKTLAVIQNRLKRWWLCGAFAGGRVKDVYFRWQPMCSRHYRGPGCCRCWRRTAPTAELKKAPPHNFSLPGQRFKQAWIKTCPCQGIFFFFFLSWDKGVERDNANTG